MWLAGGLLWTTSEAPVFEIGAIRTHRWENPRPPETAHLFAYLMSNNSLTNLPLCQQGKMRFAFAITPYAGPFDFARALRIGTEWCNPPWQQASGIPLPASGLTVKTEHPAVVVRHIFPTENRGVGIRLVETSGRQINSVLLFGGPGAIREIPFTINPYQTLTVYSGWLV